MDEFVKKWGTDSPSVILAIAADRVASGRDSSGLDLVTILRELSKDLMVALRKLP